MAARAIWKGRLCLKDNELGVKFHAAVEDRGVHFRLLHAKDRQPVRQRMVSTESSEVVERHAVRRGFEVEADRLVQLSDEELERLEPEPSRQIALLRFVPREALSHLWYLRPYWLSPDGDEAAYFALAEALKTSGREGIARWVMRKKAYLGSLRAEQGYLLMMTLRPAGEVIPASALEAPSGRELASREKKMAAQLVESLGDPLRLEDYEDQYRQRLHELISAKQRGEKPEFENYEVPRESDELEQSLRASLEAMKKAS